jgi:hypothetical protein
VAAIENIVGATGFGFVAPAGLELPGNALFPVALCQLDIRPGKSYYTLAPKGVLESSYNSSESSVVPCEAGFLPLPRAERCLVPELERTGFDALVNYDL